MLCTQLFWNNYYSIQVISKFKKFTINLILTISCKSSTAIIPTAIAINKVLTTVTSESNYSDVLVLLDHFNDNI